MARLWDRLAAEMAKEAKTVDTDLVPPHPPATLAEVEAALVKWSKRDPGYARDHVLDHLLDRKLQLQKDR